MSYAWLTLCVLLLPVLAVLVILLFSLPFFVFCPLPLSELWRRKMSQGAMGLQGHPKKAIPHGILDLATLPTFEAYCTSLERGARRTMQQSHTSLGKHGIVQSSKPSARSLRLEHLQVAIAHEKRVYASRVRAGLAGLGRFVAAKLMTGIVDEFRGPSGELLAWSQSVAKGSTLRGMWYYARPEVDKMNIWFFNVRLQVTRGHAKGLRYIDVGPSPNDSVKILKQRYGFATTANWRELEGYEGEWHCLFALLHDSKETTLLHHTVNPCGPESVTEERTRHKNKRLPHEPTFPTINGEVKQSTPTTTTTTTTTVTTTTATAVTSPTSVRSMTPRRRSKKPYNRLEDSPVLVAHVNP